MPEPTNEIDWLIQNFVKLAVGCGGKNWVCKLLPEISNKGYFK